MIIDSHAHFVPPRLLDAIRDMNSQFPSIELIKGGENSFGFSFAGQKSTRPVSKLLSDTDGRLDWMNTCLLYTSPSPRDGLLSRMPSSA